MFISHKYRAIFVHIQRTGGNSIQRIFEEHDRDLLEAVPIAPEKLRTKHGYLQDIQCALPQDVFRSYCKFAVVRNPFDRLLSWYCHLSGDRNSEDAGILYPSSLPAAPLAELAELAEIAERHESIGDRVRRAVQTQAPSFAAFVRLPADGADGLFARFHANQVDYLALDGRLAMDHILRFETLPSDFQRLAEHLGFPGRLPHRNRSARSDSPTAEYDAESRALVAARFARDCQTFGYREDGSAHAA